MTNTMTDDRKAAIANLQAVLDPRNGRTDNGCILVHERTVQMALAALSAQPSPDAAQGGEQGEVHPLGYTHESNIALFNDGMNSAAIRVYRSPQGKGFLPLYAHPPADAVSSVQDEGMVSVPKDMLELALTYVEAYEPYTESETQMCHAPCKAALQSALSRLASK